MKLPAFIAATTVLSYSFPFSCWALIRHYSITLPQLEEVGLEFGL